MPEYHLAGQRLLQSTMRLRHGLTGLGNHLVQLAP